MGDCASKPNYIETESHVHYNSTVNDAFFQGPMMISTEERETLMQELGKGVADSQKRADEYLSSINAQLENVNQRLSETHEEGKVKLVVEIRKGVDIYPVGGRNCKGVFVTLTTSPSAKTFTTPVVEAYIPKWYSLAYFTFLPGESADLLTLSAASLSSTGQETPLADLQVDLQQDIDCTYTRWLLLKLRDPFQGLSIKPQLEVRVWCLRNPFAFWYNTKEQLEKELKTVRTALTASRTGLLQSS